MQTSPVPNMFCSSYMFIIYNPHFAALLWRCIGDKKCVDSNRRRHFNFWHAFTTSQSEETWNHTQKSQKQCPVSYSLRAQRTSLAPVCVSGIPQLTFPISPAPPRRMGSRILQHPRYDQMLEDQTQIEVIHVLRPHESQKKHEVFHLEVEQR